MKQLFIKELRKDRELTDFFMVKSASVKKGSNGKQYLDIVLGDKTGEMAGKKWDLTDEEQLSLGELINGDILKIKATVTEWNNVRQLRIARIRRANEEEGGPIMDYIKAAPEPTNEMFEYIRGRAETIGDEDLKTLALKFMDDNKEHLLYYPAAQKHHHSQMGGLLYHMKRMLMSGEKLCEIYTNLDRDWIITGVIIHDIEKIREIESNLWGISEGYSFEGQLLGHIAQGIMALDKITRELGISREKAVLLEHMIWTHHYEPEFGSPMKPMFPEAEMLHYLDILDARMFDMQEAVSATEPGQFSDRMFTLDNRRVYRRL